MDFINQNIIKLKKGDPYSLNPYLTIIDDSVDDFIRVRKSGTSVMSCNLFDFTESDRPHLDGIQIIPKNNLISFRYHFIGGLIEDIFVEKCRIFTPYSKTQSIFSSDGLLRNFKIKNNFMMTSSEHKITLNGLLSGEIKRNYDLKSGGLAQIKLYPLRIGGGLDDWNVWVLNFSDYEKYSYDELDQIVFDEIEGERTFDHVLDLRREVFNDNDVFLINFDLDGFQEAAKALKESDIKNFIGQVRDLSFQFGKLFK